MILSVIAILFKINHESMMGSITSPENGDEVAKTIFGAIILYIAFFIFCGFQIFVSRRQNKIQL